MSYRENKWVCINDHYFDTYVFDSGELDKKQICPDCCTTKFSENPDYDGDRG